MDRNVVETIENIFREKIINREYDSYLKSVDWELFLSFSLSLFLWEMFAAKNIIQSNST